MATFGLLRILDTENPFGAPRLSWTFTTDWQPMLHFESQTDIDAIIQFLIERQPNRIDALALSWNDDIKCDPNKVFKKNLEAILNRLDGDDPEESAGEDAAFFAAFGSEMVTDKTKDKKLKPTAFHMTAGQQRFLKSVTELAHSLNPKERSSNRQTEEQSQKELQRDYHRALIGPWVYLDKQHSLGWDPSTEGLYALSSISPSTAGPRSEKSAVWLAFESLPLFPCVPIGNSLQTAGFDEKNEHFTWPLWESPISLDTLRPWLAAEELSQSKPDLAKLRPRGISAIFRSKCIRDGNGRGIFRNAVEIR